jgi:multidrug resistance efflux pump
MKKNKLFFLIIPILVLIVTLIIKNSSTNLIVVHPSKRNITEAVYGLGTISAAKIFHLKIGVMSMIKKIHVEEGQSIKEGAELVEFDSIPPIRSPIDGLVTYIAYKVNEIAFPQMNILTVMDIKEKYITLSLEEQAIIKIKIGQKVRIVLEAIKNKTYRGEVKAVYPGENQFIVKIISKELPEEVLPGMTADIAIETDYKKDTIVVPTQSVKEKKISLKRNGKFTEIAVKTGMKMDSFIEIIDPILNESDEIEYEDL